MADPLPVGTYLINQPMKSQNDGRRVGATHMESQRTRASYDGDELSFATMDFTRKRIWPPFVFAFSLAKIVRGAKGLSGCDYRRYYFIVLRYVALV